MELIWGWDEHDSYDVNPYDAVQGQIYISSNKEPVASYLDTEVDPPVVAGTLFTSFDRHDATFMFDVAVRVEYQSQGIGTRLTELAFDAFHEETQYYYDAGYDETPMILVDVVSGKMKKILERYGFVNVWGNGLRRDAGYMAHPEEVARDRGYAVED